MKEYLLKARSWARCAKKRTCLAARIRRLPDRNVEEVRTEREQFDMSFGARLNRRVVPDDMVELCFDAWRCGRQTALVDDLELPQNPSD